MEAEMPALPVWLRAWRILNRAIELIRSGCVGLVILIFAMHGYKVVNDSLNPWDGFKVNSVHVPDFVQGDDPLIDIDRNARAEVWGRFAAAYHRMDEDTGAICPFISPDLQFHKRSENGVHYLLFDYMGKTCDLSPGRYWIERQYTFKVPGHTPQHLPVSTNVFTVLPKPSETPDVAPSSVSLPPGD